MDINSQKPKKTCGVFERPPGSGIWWICYFENGRRHREKVGSKSVAIAAYQKRKTEIREGRFLPPTVRLPQPMFKDLAQEAMELKGMRNAASSISGDNRLLRNLLKNFGSKLAAAITTADVEKWLLRMKQDGLTDSSINRYRSLLSSIFSIGLRTGKVTINPVLAAPRFKENPSRIRILQDDEEQKLREMIRRECPDKEPELDLALNTGMRRGEQFRLQWKDVDLEKRIITLHQTKNGERRHIPLNDDAIAALKRLHSDADQFVCSVGRYLGQRDWRRWFEGCIRKAGIQDFRWHDLRHTFASRLVMAGVDLVTVKELMGHKTITMTLKYAHLSPGHKQDAVSRLQKPRGEVSQ